MHEADVAYYAQQCLWLVLLLSLPAIIGATLVGLLIGLLQALTQIQEQTLPYGFKLVAVLVAILLTARWMGIELETFTVNLFNLLPSIPP